MLWRLKGLKSIWCRGWYENI